MVFFLSQLLFTFTEILSTVLAFALNCVLCFMKMNDVSVCVCVYSFEFRNGEHISSLGRCNESFQKMHFCVHITWLETKKEKILHANERELKQATLVDVYNNINNRNSNSICSSSSSSNDDDYVDKRTETYIIHMRQTKQMRRRRIEEMLKP